MDRRALPGAVAGAVRANPARRSVDVLAELAAAVAALEFGIGTGRIALPLSVQGLRVHGIELSPAMVAQLLAEPDGRDRRVAR